MKKILIAALCLNTLFGFAQFSLKKLDGTVINDGDVFAFNELDEPGNYLGLKVYNLSAENDLYFKAKVMSITNSDGTNLQLCVSDVCLPQITAGNTYPNFPQPIAPGGSNGNFDHLQNFNGGINPNAPLEYVIKIFQVDENSVEVGTNSVTFTYRYDATLGTLQFDLNAIGISLNATSITNEIILSATQNVAFSLFDINGKLVHSQSLSVGNSSIDVSNLAAGVYIANFNGKVGKTATVKMVKR